MGWFGNDTSSPQTQSAPAEPSLDSVRALLDEIGQLRLQVKSPEMKVLLTTIAWNGEPCLMKQSGSETPSGAQLIRMSSGLEVALNVAKAYIQHEELVSPFDNEGGARLARELAAVKQFASSLTQVTSSAGFAAAMNADVTTTLLERLSQDIR